MDVRQAIEQRRAYRALDPAEAGPGLAKELARCAGLSASCYNNQPWRFVFVYDPGVLAGLFEALPGGNSWARRASMLVVVCSRPDLDCVVGERQYFLFDTGMAVSAMVLRATEMGLVAHPIAGYDEKAVKNALGIPADMTAIALVVVGRHASGEVPGLSEKQMRVEAARPERLPLREYCFLNRWGLGD
ncbi:nitroreductase family protein [Candidatus Fermentibacterales bacterium]|nr:nitroreductase family protein [Candidatus Fermentibacterales bacterium]